MVRVNYRLFMVLCKRWEMLFVSLPPAQPPKFGSKQEKRANIYRGSMWGRAGGGGPGRWRGVEDLRPLRSEVEM